MPKDNGKNYIKFYRDFLNWKWFADPPVRLVYEYLLLKANYTDTNYKGVSVPRGSCALTLSQIAADNGLTVKNVRTAIEKLKRTSEVAAVTATNVMPNFTVFTVLNYDRWQDSGNGNGSPNGNGTATVRQPIGSLEKEGKEGKNKEKSTPKGVPEKKAGPARFQPPKLEEVEAYCLERGNSVDAQRWYDYYTANGWQVGKNHMKDWKAAVRTWERNGYSQKQNAGDGMTAAERSFYSKMGVI